MPKRKPIEQFDTVFYKYSPENVAAHRRSPEYFPKVNTEGMCVGRQGSMLRVKWKDFDNELFVEENQVRMKRNA